MDIFFTDPDDVPVPPGEVRIRQLEARPWPDGRRVAVRLEITPFQKRPNAELRILNSEGREVANLSVVEALENKMELTMHLREPEPGGAYRVQMRLFYAHLDERETENGEDQSSGEILEDSLQVVDQKETSFEIENPHS